MQILCEENFNTFLKKTKAILNKWNGIVFSLTERYNILKMQICPNLIYKYEMSIKIIAHPPTPTGSRQGVSKAYMVNEIKMA